MSFHLELVPGVNFLPPWRTYTEGLGNEVERLSLNNKVFVEKFPEKKEQELLIF